LLALAAHNHADTRRFAQHLLVEKVRFCAAQNDTARGAISDAIFKTSSSQTFCLIVLMK
jgi:hypothetical protein